MGITTSLGRSDLRVPRLGVGAMTWGDPKGLARWTPAEIEALNQATLAWRT